MGNQQQQGYPSVHERFQGVRPEQFREQATGLQQAEQALRDTISEAVESGWLTPPQGIDLFAVVTTTIMGARRASSDVAASERPLSMRT